MSLEQTPHKLFTLPASGSTGNWSASINNNFRIAEQEILKLYSNFQNVQNLIGANAPYIKIDDDRYFVKIYLCNINEYPIIDNKQYSKGTQVVLKYYKKDSYSGTTWIEDDADIYIYKNDWDRIIPLYLTSYVIDSYYVNASDIEPLSEAIDSNDSRFALQDTIYHSSDLLVRVQAFGSIFSTNYISTQFVKYLSSNEYYVPQIDPANVYRMTFNKVNFIDWHTQNPDTLEFHLPHIGLGVFNNFTCKKGDIGDLTITMNGENISIGSDSIFSFNDGILSASFEYTQPYLDNRAEYMINVDFYLQAIRGTGDDAQEINTPVIISHKIIKDKPQDNNQGAWLCKYTIEVDISNLPNDNTLYCTFFVTDKENNVDT